MNENEIKNLDEFLKKMNDLKAKDKFDLSADEDLSVALMNLISLEEHFFFTGSKSENKNYFNLLNEVREMRKKLMKKIEKNPSFEEHCIMKHLLAASMRLMEVGTKKLSENKKEEAYELFSFAYNLYSLFWGINLKAVKLNDLEKIDDESINKHDDEKMLKDKNNIFKKLGDLVKKAIDCCIE
jgi:hypothetical protein